MLNNDWNTHIVQILHEIRDANVYFQSKFAHYTAKTCLTNALVDPEKFQLSRARVLL